MSGALSATAAGVIAFAFGLLLAIKGDAPRTRIALLVAGSTTITGGVIATFSGKAAATITDVSASATQALAGTAVGILGLLVLVWLVVRDTLKGGVSHWTDTAAVLMPPAASTAGGFVWALCLLLASVVGMLITGAWSGLGDLAGMIRSSVG